MVAVLPISSPANLRRCIYIINCKVAFLPVSALTNLQILYMYIYNFSHAKVRPAEVRNSHFCWSHISRVTIEIYIYIYISGLLKVREPGNRVPSHLAKVAARNH